MSIENPRQEAGELAYAVGDRLVSHLSGLRYEVTEIDDEDRRLKFAMVEDPEDESGWEDFESVAHTFRHFPREDDSQ
ncbi:hypothetical protein ACWEOE_10780 [Amycolatopsis sp. NPDC004368]